MAAALLAAGCAGSGPLARLAPARSAHEAYAESLRNAGLDAVALGRAWLDAGAAALASPQAVALPIRETGYLDPSRPAAIGYRFDLERGRRLAVTIAFESREPAQVFLDLFRLDGGAPERVASADAGALGLDYVARATASYVLRLQPELLRGGRYTITQRTEASLRFPVSNAGDRDVHSGFGDARDGGRRDHHGVDIFAPRGTPVVAAADGRVRSVATTDIGGRVIWLHDIVHGQSLYYAHLEDWAVREGQQVRAGEVIGFVGNTGNARSTPPHLHFGIYARGPVDPMPFIRMSDREPPDPAGAVAFLGGWARVARGPATLRSSTGDARAAAATLPVSTAVHVRAARASFFRVALPDGREGFIEARSLTFVEPPLRVARLRRPALLREQPSPAAVVIRELDQGYRLPVLAEFGSFLLVEGPAGAPGWVSREQV